MISATFSLLSFRVCPSRLVPLPLRLGFLCFSERIVECLKLLLSTLLCLSLGYKEFSPSICLQLQ